MNSSAVVFVRRPEPAPAGLRFDLRKARPGLTTQLLILQSTPFCNIDCDYCYLPGRSRTERMSMATLRLAAATRRLPDSEEPDGGQRMALHGRQ